MLSQLKMGDLLELLISPCTWFLLFFFFSQLRPPMMASLLRKLVVDVPALTDNTVVALRVSIFCRKDLVMT